MFKFNDQVKIKEGFYEGCTGKLFGFSSPYNGSTIYFVALDNAPRSAEIFEENLEKIEE